jgi:acyl-CoA synthetase (NDP forming)
MSSQDIPNMDVKDISFIDNIKSMAVIGDSKKRDFFFVRNHYENFIGDIYCIHPSIKSLDGFDDGTQGRIYPSVKDVPGPVDFVFITVPQSQILKVMDDCVQKGVKLASIFTADFSDAGTEEGRNLEKELLKKADNKVRILGPNGMGLYCPKLGITWRKFPTISGKVGLVAQSGGVCNIAIYMALELGMYFTKVFSFGNGIDLDFVDVLYYLSNDPETEIILCYLEGIKEGRGNALQRVLAQNKKPIIMLKGGQTDTGKVAAKSHTAAIAGKNDIWKAFFKQHNIIEVDSLEQLIYAAKLIENYGIFKFENAAVFSVSGGYGVIMVDLIEKAGIRVPPFSPEIQNQLSSKFFTHGTSSKNPLDVSAQIYQSEAIHDIIDLALSDEKIDGLIMDLPSFYFSVDFHLRRDEEFEDNMISYFGLGHKYKKPLIPILQRVSYPEDRKRALNKLVDNKVPVFGDPLEFIPLLTKISKCAEKQKRKEFYS